MKIINVMASSVDGFIGAKPNESDIERQKVNISSKVDHDHLLVNDYILYQNFLWH